MISWLFSKYYDSMLRDAEERCLQSWRKELLQDISGDVLELGAGTGLNLPYYTNEVHQLTLTEPNRHMRNKLKESLSSHAHQSAEIRDCSAESLPFADCSFDVVVSTLVFCTVKNLKIALNEAYRVLKPGGKLVFIEHVVAKNRPDRLKWQQRIQPFWKLLQCGCHLTRDTEAEILSAGFDIIKISRQSMRAGFHRLFALVSMGLLSSYSEVSH